MTAFHDLHRSGLLILPNVADAGGATLMRSLGAKAIATTSAGVAWALGYPDGDALPARRLIGAVEDVVRRASDLPVSVDIEGGFSDDPAKVAGLAGAMFAAGASGINIEDGSGLPAELAAKIAAIRKAVGPDLFINARCDLWLRGIGEADDRLAEAKRRATLYAEAGADGFFAPGLAETGTIGALVEAVDQPINLLAVPGLPDADVLQALGVRRLSAGSGLAQASWGLTARLARAFLATGKSAPLGDGAMVYGDINALMTEQAQSPRPCPKTARHGAGGGSS